MNNRPIYFFLLLLLSALAISSLWLEYAIQTKTSIAHVFGANEPDYIVRNFTITRTNLAGVKQYTLWSIFAQHFPANDTTFLTTPVMHAQDAKQGDASIHSDRAVALAQGKQVNFIGNVVLVRDQHTLQGPLTLTTNYLEALPDEQIMRTSQPVVIVGQAEHITAGGMLMNNHLQQINLFHKVSVHYAMAH